MARPRSSTVSVDVLPLRFNADAGAVQVALTRRSREPYRDQLALPGVVLTEGERLADAATRAVAKLGLTLDARGQLAVFDEPTRDPRGATLSIATWGVVTDMTESRAQWFTLDDLPELAFDHNDIVRQCRPLLVNLLWRDEAFTRALTGPTFPVSAAVAITRSLTGIAPDRGNLNRRLASVKGLGVSTHKVVLGRGRPGTLWEWTGETAVRPVTPPTEA